jgi:LDH2 family malate/lactate/ureidoglycolate dehydrogenase
MEVAIRKAKQHGMGSVSVRRNGHCGAIAYYAQMAVDAGCLAFAATTGGTAIAPVGGIEARCGLNPISWAAPTRQGWAFNLDMAPSVVAGSKVDMVRQRGERLPWGWAIDAKGEPTDDPVAAREGGTLLPIGGYKGVGLSIAAEILCGVFSGSKFGQTGGGSGHLFQAIDIEQLMPLTEFTERMEQMIEYVKSSALAPGSSGITLPGELEWQKRQDYTANGIPLDRPTRHGLREAAEEAGAPYDIEL